MKGKIDRFAGKNAFLSNFWPCNVNMYDINFKTAEHAYQASKSSTKKDMLLIADLTTPGNAKRMGRRITIRPDWEEIKLGVMLSVVRRKFQNPMLAKRLLATYRAELIEGNVWYDTYWGVCNGLGENHLGKILMLVRAELKDRKDA